MGDPQTEAEVRRLCLRKTLGDSGRRKSHVGEQVNASRARRFTEFGTRHRQQHVRGTLCYRSDDECLCVTSTARLPEYILHSERDAFLTVFTTTTDVIIMNQDSNLSRSRRPGASKNKVRDSRI